MSDETGKWLVLVHQFPQNPGSLRVKVWRRLQSIGAIAIKHSMYVLPNTDQTHEDFAWLLEEIRSGGAEGAILEARFVDGMDDRQIRALFDEARDDDYTALSQEVQGALDQLTANVALPEKEFQAARHQLSKFKKRLSEIEGIDFFGAGKRGATQSLVGMLAERLAAAAATDQGEEMKPKASKLEDLKGRVWVTRRGVRVDRIACAWLVKRWIDPTAVFKFSADKKYRPTSEREIRFDMFEGEITHEGDKCSFEVLLERAGLDDPALRRIGEIIHDIDLKDGRYGHEETAGVAMLLNGITAAIDDDDQRIVRGGTIFENLYSSFQTTEGRRRRAEP